MVVYKCVRCGIRQVSDKTNSGEACNMMLVVARRSGRPSEKSVEVVRRARRGEDRIAEVCDGRLEEELWRHSPKSS